MMVSLVYNLLGKSKREFSAFLRGFSAFSLRLYTRRFSAFSSLVLKSKSHAENAENAENLLVSLCTFAGGFLQFEFSAFSRTLYT